MEELARECPLRLEPAELDRSRRLEDIAASQRFLTVPTV